jgi:Fe-S cluster assembly protein SufD
MMAIATKMLTSKDRFIKLFNELKSTSFSTDPTFISQLREYAITHFEKLGIPNRRDEQWKYTPIAKALNFDWEYQPLTNSYDDGYTITPDLNAHEIILQGNQLKMGANPLPNDVIALSLKAAFNSGNGDFERHYGSYAQIATEPFTALNTAFAETGAFIHVPDGVTLDLPIHIITIVDNIEAACIHPRNLIVTEKNSSIKLIETTQVINKNNKPLLINSVSEIICGENTFVDRYQVQGEGCSNIKMINTTQVHQKAYSNYTNTSLAINTEFTRNNINVEHDGEYCETNMNGLYTLDQNQHLDNHTVVNHNVPNCLSNELYIGILKGKATGIFNGKVYVKKDAQKTNAFQSNKNILLSDDATMNSKPELEIYADDVKCSHGSTTGELEEEALFYLRSRGISQENATVMLLHGFVGEIIERIKVEPLKEFLSSKLETRLNQ